jgi:hypothetical protein
VVFLLAGESSMLRTALICSSLILSFIALLSLPVPAQEASVVCTMEAMACPDGSYVSRTGPHCEFAPCPGKDGSAESSTGTVSPQQIVYPDQPGSAYGPDYPLETPPATPVTVKFLVEHRTALNEKRVTVHGVIVATLLGDKACPPDRGMCAQPRITIADIANSSRDTSYDLEILLPEEGNDSYNIDQIVDISGTVSASPSAVILSKE